MAGVCREHTLDHTNRTDPPWPSTNPTFLTFWTSAGSSTNARISPASTRCAAKREVIAYVGYDCTAPSLHVGNLISIMMLHWLQQTGNKPIALMGGGTTRVGDPSGKDETRSILTDRADRGQQGQHQGRLRQVPRRSATAPTDAIMLDNAEWLTKLNYIDFLRDVGRHFSVNRMLTMDSVKLRLEREQELSFIEFNYMILQAYDFVELARALRLQPADGRLRPVGQHRHRHRSRPAHGHAPALRADHAAADHLVRRQDGQDRGGRRVAQRRHAVAPTTTGSSGATPRTRDVGALPQAVHDAAAGRDRAGSRRCRAPRSTRPRRCWRPKPPPCCTAAQGRCRRRETAQQTFEEGAMAEGLPTVEIAAAELDGGPRRAHRRS